jgi:hypothetical protein
MLITARVNFRRTGMRAVLVALGVCALMAGSVGTVYAAATQQEKIKACNTQADAKKLYGAARDTYVKKCAGT